MTIAERIRSTRLQRGLSQATLAKALGVTTQAISQWENEKTTPDYGRLNNIANALSVGIAWLHSGEGSDGSITAEVTARAIPVVSLEESLSFSPIVIKTTPIDWFGLQLVVPTFNIVGDGFAVKIDGEMEQGKYKEKDLVLFSSNTEIDDGDMVIAISLSDASRAKPLFGQVSQEIQDGETCLRIRHLGEKRPDIVIGGFKRLGMVIAVMIEHRILRTSSVA